MARRSARHARIRYGVVGLGHIAQVAVLPAFAGARNAELAALVSDDSQKLDVLSRQYGVTGLYSYEQYEDCLAGVDAVYIALPNSLHAEYTIRAADAGVHVLCEKPMAVTVEECEAMIAACERARVKLMIAYRLHFERVNLRMIELIKQGAIGEPKIFNSTFTMRVRPGDIRTQRELGGGALHDIGVYCINAARYLFRAEPKEVFACSVNSSPERLPEIDESTAAILRFEGERVASFVTSFNAADVSSYEVVGTKGHIRVDPAYEHSEGLGYEITIEGKRTKRKTRKRDQFAAELVYFSDCILNDKAPEPSGEEGLQDVRIVTAVYESAETGKPVPILPYRPDKRPDLRQEIERPPAPAVDVVRAPSPTE